MHHLSSTIIIINQEYRLIPFVFSRAGALLPSLTVNSRRKCTTVYRQMAGKISLLHAVSSSFAS
jgi:hypothetical protein